MSESTAERPERPSGVTDPLLWRLAAAVADAHEADEDGACRNLSCAGAEWPCAAWTSAQEGLRVAQAAPRPTPDSSADESAGDLDRDHPLTGWSINLPRSLRLDSPAPAVAPKAVASAA
ncbi:MAG: hypothetical protein WA890_25490 [Micromonospora sp.]